MIINRKLRASLYVLGISLSIATYAVTVNQEGSNVTVNLSGKQMNVNNAVQHLEDLCKNASTPIDIRLVNISKSNIEAVEKLAPAIVNGYKANHHTKAKITVVAPNYDWIAKDIIERLDKVDEARENDIARQANFNEKQERARERMYERIGHGAGIMLAVDPNYADDYLSEEE